MDKKNTEVVSPHNQEDTILRFDSLCSAAERGACPSALSERKIARPVSDDDQSLVQKEDFLCETRIPATCVRVTCRTEGGVYEPCRMSDLIEYQANEHGHWLRLPCKTCWDKKDLNPTTERFVFNEQ